MPILSPFFLAAFSLTASLSSADIALIRLMYPLMPRCECKCEIVNSSMLLGFASDLMIAYWKISFLYLIK